MIPPGISSLGARVVTALRQWWAGLAAIGRRAIDSLEGTLASLASKVFELAERLTTLDDLVASVLLGPWRIVRKIGMKLGAFRGARLVAWPLGWLLRTLGLIGSAFGHAASGLNLDPLVRWGLWATWPIWRPIGEVAGFARAWLVSRPPKQMLWGIPVLGLIAGVLYLAGVAPYGESPATVAAYRAALAAATESGNHADAQLYERKLGQLGASTDRQHFQKALALESQGQLAEACDLMQQLAPDDRPGYPPAHLWLARQAMSGKLSLDPANRDRLLDSHLAHLAALGVRGPEVELLASLRLLQQGELEAAATRLRPLADEMASAASTLLQIDLQLGRIDQAERDAKIAVRHYEASGGQDGRWSADDYGRYALALAVVGEDERRYEHLLGEWLREFPADARARRHMLHFVQGKCERLIDAASANPQQLARQLQQASELGADATWIGSQITRLYTIRDNAVVANPLPEQVVRTLLASDATPPSLLYAIGVQAALATEWERAEEGLTRVVALEPTHALAWNNIAWVVLQTGDRDRLSEALDQVERALRLAPGEARFRETRGQIWLKLGQWRRALADLEYARAHMPPSPALDNALATAYAAVRLGETPAKSESAKNPADL